MDIDDLEINEGMEDLEVIGNELTVATESVNESLRMITVLEAIASDYKSGKISDDQVRYVSFALESAFTNDREALKEVLATENILTRIIQGIAKFFMNIKEAIKKQVEYTQYSFTLFNVQKQRIRKIRGNLASASGHEAEVKIGINKYMMFGEDKRVVSSMDEYIKQYLIFTKTMTPFMSGLVDLIEDDLWSSLKFYKDYIFGDPEDYITERFTSMERSLNKAAAGLSDKKTISKSTYVEHDSGTMLGLSKVMIRLPQKSSYNIKDIETIISAHRFFYMYVDRRPKFNLGSLLEGQTRLTVSKNHIEKILAESEKLIGFTNELLSFSNQLSHAGAALNTDVAYLNRREAKESYDPAGVIKGVQLFARICSIIFDSTSSGYNYSLGNIKNALSISEKALKRM